MDLPELSSKGGRGENKSDEEIQEQREEVCKMGEHGGEGGV